MPSAAIAANRNCGIWSAPGSRPHSSDRFFRFIPPVWRHAALRHASFRSLAVALAVDLLLAGQLVLFAGPVRAAASPAAPIDASVLAGLASKGGTTAWVVLKAHADLSPAFAIHDWNARGRFVYERLSATARQSQAGLRAFLAGTGARFQAFWQIVMPLSSPGLIATSIFTFIQAWNEYVYARTFLNRDVLLTLQPGLQKFFGEFSTNWPGLMAAQFVSSVPVVVLFLVLQRYFVRALAEGATKA